MKRFVISAAIVAASWATQAMAIDTFAGYTTNNSAKNFKYTESTVSASGKAEMSITDTVVLTITGLGQAVNANLVLNAAAPNSAYTSFIGTDGVPATGVQGFAGTLDFYLASATVINGITYVAGSDLLHGVFSNAVLTRLTDTTGAMAQSGSLDTQIAYSSPAGLFTFDTNSAKDLVISLSSAASVDGTQSFTFETVNGTTYLKSATASSSGTFGTTPLPTIASPIPEPATWMAMIAGFGILGASLRRRRTTAAFG